MRGREAEGRSRPLVFSLLSSQGFEGGANSDKAHARQSTTKRGASTRSRRIRLCAVEFLLVAAFG